MKCAQAWIITNAACEEHQFFVRIKYEENINKPAWVKCWKNVDMYGCMPATIIFCNKNEVNDQKKNNGHTIIHKI